jgi:hypothetical protein
VPTLLQLPYSCTEFHAEQHRLVHNFQLLVEPRDLLLRQALARVLVVVALQAVQHEQHFVPLLELWRHSTCRHSAIRVVFFFFLGSPLDRVMAICAISLAGGGAAAVSDTPVQYWGVTDCFLLHVAATPPFLQRQCQDAVPCTHNYHITHDNPCRFLIVLHNYRKLLLRQWS